MIETFFFYMFSAVLIISALLVISAQNPVHSVLFLILAFFNAAGIFLMLGAEFLAMTMVIVYVGAVAVLFLFVVMMLDIHFADLRRGAKKHVLVGGLAAALLLAELVTLFGAWSGKKGEGQHPIPEGVENTPMLGRVLYTDYVYLFQVSGFILLTAMVGAIVLTHRDRLRSRHQDIATQLARQPKDVVKIEKITSGSGVF